MSPLKSHFRLYKSANAHVMFTQRADSPFLNEIGYTCDLVHKKKFGTQGEFHPPANRARLNPREHI